MGYIYDMRKIFEKRARLVVYIESVAADEMERKARGNGMTLAEWTRTVLLNALGGYLTATEVRKAPGCREAVGPGIFCGECGKRHN